MMFMKKPNMLQPMNNMKKTIIGIVIGFFGFGTLLFTMCLLISKTIVGFYYNPFTDSGWHTVVSVYHYSMDEWTHNKTTTVSGAIWHDMNLMSIKDLGSSVYITLPDSAKEEMEYQVDSVTALLRHRGDSIIKLIK